MNAPLVHPPTADTVPSSEGTTPVMAHFLAAKASQPESETILPGELVNVTVVDEQDTMVNYYATGKTEIFNPKNE